MGIPRSSRLIRKIHFIKCPACGRTHDAEVREAVFTNRRNGITYSYRYRFYLCENSKSDFNLAEMQKENCERMQEAYEEALEKRRNSA